MYHGRDNDVETQSLSSASGASASFCSAAESCFSESSGFDIESEVGRDALVQICCSSLSRLLDFPDSQLETLLSTNDEQAPTGEDDGGVNVARNIASSLKMMKRSIGSGLHAISHMYHHPRHQHQEVYNIHPMPDTLPISHHRLTFGTPISGSGQIVLLQIITHIENFVSHEGIFRKSGSKNRINQLVHDLGEKDFQQILLSEMYKPHDYSTMLKQFFSELPEPLLLKRHLNAYIQTAGLSSPAATTKSLQLLMLLLPPSNRIVAQHLLQLLSLVASCTQSKMDAHNLALVFAPTLFLSGNMKGQDSAPAEILEKVVQLLQYMIMNPIEIFEVPHEVQVVAERYCKKREAAQVCTNFIDDGVMLKAVGMPQEEDIALDVCSTYCQQESTTDYHAAGKERAENELAALYEVVKNMPDGPQKTHFLKKFERKLVTTPTSKSHSKSNKENFITPKGNSRHFKVLSKSSRKPPPHPQALLPPGSSKTPISKKAVLSELADTPIQYQGRPSVSTVLTPRNIPRQTLSIPTMSPMVTDV